MADGEWRSAAGGRRSPLTSDEASYITGATIYADGGRLPPNGTVSVPAAAIR